MKNLMILLTSLLVIAACSKQSSPTPPVTAPVSDSFTVTVNNGYGGGKFKAGDTVHIFSAAYADNQVFNSWAGSDISLLDDKDEWHTWLIMPAKNVSFTGSVTTISSFSLQFEQIRGRDRMKPVYYYFPANHKGIVYLLHGTGGNAANVANSFEFQLLTRDLVNNGLAVIITEAEEATTGIDANGDGKLRWSTTPWDTTTNVDYANIRIITDTFYHRGLTDRSKPLYSVGMSNGGNFSASLGTIYHFKAAVSYCAPAGGPIAQTSTTPIQFCMARYDNNENVGPAGNANALANSQTLSGRGICSKYLINEHSPLYPERFARRGDISIAQSAAVFNELKSKGFLDSRNYFIGYSPDLVTAYQANPASFPSLNSLTILQRYYVTQEIDLAVADHQMYSDYNRATLKFLNTQCQ
jgi:dienelactone hydrolase